MKMWVDGVERRPHARWLDGHGRHVGGRVSRLRGWPEGVRVCGGGCRHRGRGRGWLPRVEGRVDT